MPAPTANKASPTPAQLCSPRALSNTRTPPKIGHIKASPPPSVLAVRGNRGGSEAQHEQCRTQSDDGGRAHCLIHMDLRVWGGLNPISGTGHRECKFYTSQSVV